MNNEELTSVRILLQDAWQDGRNHPYNNHTFIDYWVKKGMARFDKLKLSVLPPLEDDNRTLNESPTMFTTEQMYKCWREAIDGNMMFKEFMESLDKTTNEK